MWVAWAVWQMFAKLNVRPCAHGEGDCWEYGRKRRREEIAHYFPKAISVQKDGWPSVTLLKELTSVLCCGTTSSTHSQQDIYSDSMFFWLCK